MINIVNYDMVQQTYLTSRDYGKGINEFTKAGFTELASDKVKPPRVAESTVQLECVVNDVISLGKNGGAGNLVISEVKRMHINEAILDADGKIDPCKIDLVARLGGDWYCRVTNDNLFKLSKPSSSAVVGIGVDAFPKDVKYSEVLTGNHLGILGLVESLPSDEEVRAFSETSEMKELIDAIISDSHTRTFHLHLKAKQLLDDGRVIDACKVLLM